MTLEADGTIYVYDIETGDVIAEYEGLEVHNVMRNVSEEMLAQYAKSRGAYEVWRSWVVAMLTQGREVTKERLDWSTLPDRDKDLDSDIAFCVARDCLEWIKNRESR